MRIRSLVCSFLLILVAGVVAAWTHPPGPQKRTPVRRPAPASLPRVDVATLNANSPQIRDLVVAIRKMQAIRDPKDCRGWTYQGLIHGSMDGAPGTGTVNQCEHASYHFLAWHRMYIYYFEQLVQQFSGDPNFRLPYWNWSTPGPVPIPPVFLQKILAGVSNPLMAARNDITAIDDESYDLGQVFAPSNFFHIADPDMVPRSFGGFRQPPGLHTGTAGTLEYGPHQRVHEALGGWMANAYSAAQYPLFFLHHANVDRLWESWVLNQYGKNPTDDNYWITTPFTFCKDTSGGQPNVPGTPVKETIQNFLNTAAVGYTYDHLEKPAVPTPLPQRPLSWLLFAAATVPSQLDSSETRIPLAVTRQINPRNVPGRPVLRLMFRKLTWKKEPHVRYQVLLEPTPAKPGGESIFIGYLHFYRFGLMHGSRDGRNREAYAEFLLPPALWDWFARSNSAEPVQVHLIRRSLASQLPVRPVPGSEPAIGAVQILAGR